MLQNSLRNRPGKLYTLQKVVTRLGVLLNHLVFDICQLARLAEDFGRDENLADVVHRARKSQPVDLRFRHPEFMSNRARKSRDASLMPSRVRIAQLDGTGEGLDRLLHGPLGLLMLAVVDEDADERRPALPGRKRRLGEHIEQRAVTTANRVRTWRWIALACKPLARPIQDRVAIAVCNKR